MATLTEVSVMVRKLIKWGSITLVIMALIPGTISAIKKIYLMLNPPPPPPPSVKFGKLPRLIFPETAASATPEYKLETISGSLPSLPSVGKVYLVGINKSRLLVLERMTQKARQLNLDIGPEELSERLFRYKNSKWPIDMTFDVITGSFAYKYDWTTDRTIYNTYNVPQKTAAEREAKAFFQRMGVLQDDLANGSAIIINLAATSSAMVPVDTIYDANFVRVDIFRKEKDEVKFVTAGGDTSPVNVILSGKAGDQKVVQGNYYYSQIIGEGYETYPLKSVEAAWRELISGGGYIAKQAVTNKVVVRRVGLALYESNQQQDFLQPVYVFEGDTGFLAYVHAISPEYITE